MTSAAKIAANRRNARKSTGPRTACGKAMVRNNALKHGLAIPVPDARVMLLANELFLASKGEFTWTEAQAAAEVHLEVDRVRTMRTAILTAAAKNVVASPDDACVYGFVETAPLLASLDRYEDRALGRRRRALKRR